MVRPSTTQKQIERPGQLRQGRLMYCFNVLHDVLQRSKWLQVAMKVAEKAILGIVRTHDSRTKIAVFITTDIIFFKEKYL